MAIGRVTSTLNPHGPSSTSPQLRLGCSRSFRLTVTSTSSTQVPVSLLQKPIDAPHLLHTNSASILAALTHALHLSCAGPPRSCSKANDGLSVHRAASKAHRVYLELTRIRKSTGRMGCWYCRGYCPLSTAAAPRRPLCYPSPLVDRGGQRWRQQQLRCSFFLNNRHRHGCSRCCCRRSH